MTFTNVYYKRAAGTPKACYICYKPTTTVLATIDTIDFLYTCSAHLRDSDFAIILGDNVGNARKAGPTAEEISKIKKEWEEKQKKKLERDKEKVKEGEGKKDDVNDEDGAKEKVARREKSNLLKLPGSLSTPTPPKSTHEQYALHRNYFAMRVAEHRKRRQATQAKELAPRLPGAPSGSLTDKS